MPTTRSRPKPENRRMIEALLGEYRLAVADLKRHIADVTDAELVQIADRKTKNPDCVSIQSILTHVEWCGRRYVQMIDVHRGNKKSPAPRRMPCASAKAYRAALDAMMQDTEVFFEGVRTSEMMRYDPAKKLKTSWGQLYDYEQLLEHAIVHVARHRRQVQEFKRKMREKP